MRHDGDEGFYLFLMWMFVAFLFFNMEEPRKVVVVPAPEKPTTTEQQMTKAGVVCATCPDTPGGVERVRQTALFEGPTISLPTYVYLVYLSERCGEMNRVGVHECRRLLKEVVIGESDINSRVNPIYGRGEFTEKQLAYIKWGSARTMELLRSLEYQFIGTKRDRFLREQHMSREILLPARILFIKAQRATYCHSLPPA